MKKILVAITVLTLAIGGCARPVNGNYRSPRDQRAPRRPAPPVEQSGPDRRPNPY